MVTFKKRLGIYAAGWLLIGFAFACAPLAPSEYPEQPERAWVDSHALLRAIVAERSFPVANLRLLLAHELLCRPRPL